jgi:hypothetical protein
MKVDRFLPQLDREYFTSKHDYNAEQSSILRIIYYPPTSYGTDAQNDIRAGAHSDYGTCTLLFQVISPAFSRRMADISIDVRFRKI